MVVTELVTNAVKHGPDEAIWRLGLGLRADGPRRGRRRRRRRRDDRPRDIRAPGAGLGLQIVDALCRRLGQPDAGPGGSAFSSQPDVDLPRA